MRAIILACIIILMGNAVSAQSPANPALPDADACLPGIAAAEQAFALPPKLLHTIGVVESGRFDPVTSRVAPWPWTIYVNGTGQIFATKAAAITAVQSLQKAGTRSIDIGCMQINLMHHPDAFASLDEAFDPRANTQYGAHFLRDLHQELGNWLQAAGAYHSRTQDIGASYEMRVMALWPMAGQFPDATLQLRRRMVVPKPDLSHYTPEFAAQVRQMRAESARLAATFGPIAAPRLPTAPVRIASANRILADTETRVTDRAQ